MEGVPGRARTDAGAGGDLSALPARDSATSSSSVSARGFASPRRRSRATTSETLLPQYAAGEAIPPLDKVAPRIEEILLEQQVNVLFDDWLNNLRKQGDVEVLDPALGSP